MLRTYRHPEDFERVSAFLVQTYQPSRQPSNWLQPRWEYMHYLCVPMFGMKADDLAKIGVWEDKGKIVGVVHFEDAYGQAYFQTHPDYPQLKEEMLRFAEDRLAARGPDGTRSLDAYINDWDDELIAVARSRGYRKKEDAAQYMSRLDPRDLPAVSVPEGFTLKSLADDNDLAKVARCLHRGFNHPGEPPEGGIETIRHLQTAPNFRKELNVVVQSPAGDFVSYCGVWHEIANRFAMVEPVATDPEFRRMGLGKAAVLEAIRQAGQLGATVAYVATDKPFYLAIGFRKISARHPWEKTFQTM